MRTLGIALFTIIFISFFSCKESVSEDNIRKISSDFSMQQKEYEGMKEIYNASSTKRELSELSFKKKTKEFKSALSVESVRKNIYALRQQTLILSAENRKHLEAVKVVIDSSSAFITSINLTINSNDVALKKWLDLNEQYEQEANAFYRTDKQLTMCENQLAKALELLKNSSQNNKSKKTKRK